MVPWLLRLVARTGSRELFTLSVLAIALGIAYGSAELFGVSLALGAFFAGVVLSESDFSYQAAADSLPLQDAFAVLFFVSVGMLFDPGILVRQPLAVLASSCSSCSASPSRRSPSCWHAAILSPRRSQSRPASRRSASSRSSLQVSGPP
jgi:Kef-type K+ transport system membrane component KefB